MCYIYLNYMILSNIRKNETCNWQIYHDKLVWKYVWCVTVIERHSLGSDVTPGRLMLRFVYVMKSKCKIRSKCTIWLVNLFKALLTSICKHLATISCHSFNKFQNHSPIPLSMVILHCDFNTKFSISIVLAETTLTMDVLRLSP